RRGVVQYKWTNVRRDNGIFIADNRACRRKYQSRVRSRMHDDREARSGPLQQVHVDDGPRRLLEPVLPCIADDTDHGEEVEVPVHVAELKGLTDGIPSRPLRLREGLVDHSGVRRVEGVAALEQPPPEKRDAERLE